MRPGSTPCASAASATVEVSTGSSMTSMSGACAAKKARTESRLIGGSCLAALRDASARAARQLADRAISSRRCCPV